MNVKTLRKLLKTLPPHMELAIETEDGGISPACDGFETLTLTLDDGSKKLVLVFHALCPEEDEVGDLEINLN